MIKIHVQLYGIFRLRNKKNIELKVKDNTKILTVLKLLGIDKNEISILLLNGEVANTGTGLANNDKLSIFPPIGGG